MTTAITTAALGARADRNIVQDRSTPRPTLRPMNATRPVQTTRRQENGLALTTDDPAIVAAVDALEAELLRYGKGVGRYLDGPAAASDCALAVAYAAAVDVLGGKIEFESGEEGREGEILTHLLRTATAETVRQRFRGLDFALLVEAVEDGATITTGGSVTARDVLTGLPVLGESDLYDQICERVNGEGGGRTDGETAAAIELALEGLFLARKIGKDVQPGATGAETVYG